MKSPARVLWYVSDDPAYPQSKAIRACSYIDDVVVGRPKDLFRRFKRLGVYEWKDVYRVAKENIAKDIMAFTFSQTELFSKPIDWNNLQIVLRAHSAKGSQIQSPTEISEACFFEIYRHGMQLNAA